MAAKAYNPFQTEFATEDELLGNPRSGLKRNPSKAYETIVAAVKADPDSWIHKKGDNYVYVILSGPMTGTYTLGPRKKSYSPTFEVALNPDNVDLLGLYRLRYEAIMKRVSGIEDAIVAALDYPEPEATAEGEKTNEDYHWDWFLKIIEMPDDEYSDRYLQGEALDREKARLAARLRKEKAYKADPAGYEAKFRELRRMENRLKRNSGSLAQTAYIMAQAAGIPTEKVIADLREKPKRHMSLSEAQIPGRLTDRVKYCKAFFQRWSVQDAMNAVVKGVEGGIPTGSQYGYMGEPAAIRAALAGVPSWKQKAMRGADEMANQRFPDAALYRGTVDPYKKMRDEERKKRTPDAILEFVLRAVELQKKLSRAGMPANQFREILSKRDIPYLAHLSDAAAGIREGLAVLSENNEGRILIRALNQKDWPTVYRGHDVAVAAAYEARTADETPEGRARAEAHKSLARQFVFPPGVRPLVTKAEYAVEGREMNHCVYSMGYYAKMSSFEFAFAAFDGTRATLELGTDGVVRQFFGPHDSTPSAATKKMLDQFLSVNADNIKAMRKGEFPVKPAVTNPLERADDDTAAVMHVDKEMGTFQFVVFSLADYAKYKKSGSENMLKRSIIGYLDVGEWRPNWAAGQRLDTATPPGAVMVSTAVSVAGYGPLLYATALKMLEKRKKTRLYPDTRLSPHAKAFWARFPKGYMEPMDTGKFTSVFGVSATTLARRGQSLSAEEAKTIILAGDDLFYEIYNDMDANTGKLPTVLPRQKYLNSLAKKAAATIPLAANPFNHFPRRNRR